MGEGFARLNGNLNRVKDLDCMNAIARGQNEAAHRDAIEAELTQDPDFLRGLGFHGVDEDD